MGSRGGIFSVRDHGGGRLARSEAVPFLIPGLEPSPGKG